MIGIGIRLRQLMVPVHEIEAALPKQGLIYEVGSGSGVLSEYLARSSSKRSVIGVDSDTIKINRARQNFPYSNLRFEIADATTYPYRQCESMVLSDFLHHVDYQTQKKILQKITRALSAKGVLIIKEIDRSDGILALCSRIWDFLFYPQDTIYYRSKAEWIKILKKLGFNVTVSRQVWWFPGSTFLYLCTKK